MILGEGLTITNHVPGYPHLNQGLHIKSGRTFRTNKEIEHYFSYYGNHVIEGTLIGGPGFNANECVDGSPLSTQLLSCHSKNKINDILLGNLGLICSNPDVIERFKEEYASQNPIYTGKFGEDLQTLLGENGNSVIELAGFVPVVIEHTFKKGSQNIPYNQSYIVSVPKDKGNYNAWWSEVMVGTRQELYSLYEDIFGLKYPKKPTYTTWQTEEKAVELRADLVTPDGGFHDIKFQSAVGSGKIQILRILEGNYHIKIEANGKEMVMKKNGELEVLN